MTRLLVPLAVAALVCVPARLANAQTCPPAPPLFDQAKKIETEGAIGQVAKIVGVKLGFKVDNNVIGVLKSYPNADQLVVILTAMHTYCTLIMSDPNLTGAQKLKLLRESYEELKIVRANGPQAIATTAPSQRDAIPPLPAEPEKRSRWDSQGRFIRVAAAAPVSNEIVYVSDGKPSWADIYLNPLPIIITDGNKYFVIVGSAGSESEGRKRMSILKSKNPRFDFELFAPYGSNNNYAIMMASWVSSERAREALAEAKRIERTSFIWSCRQTGSAC
jgi:hypothetical protein